MEKPADERRDAATVVNEVMEDWLFTTPEIMAKPKAVGRKPKPRGGTQLDPSNLRKMFYTLLTAAKLRRVRFLTYGTRSQACSFNRAKASHTSKSRWGIPPSR